MNKNTVVFLHGAGLSAWVWDRVVPLVATGSLALEVPARSHQATPATCASSLVSALDDRGLDRFVVAMHSLAGVLAADLGHLLEERLAACVYVSAVIPAEGSTFAKAIGFPGRFLLPLLFRMNPGGLKPSEAMIRKELCADLTEGDAAMVVDRYEAEFPGLYLSTVGAPPSCRSAYIKLSNDLSVPPAQQLKMIARLANPQVSEIESGHLVMLSHPKELTDIINGIASSA